MRAISPALAWSDETYLLARLDYTLRTFVWMFSEDGSKGTNRPDPMRTPAEIAADMDDYETAATFDESGDFLKSILPAKQAPEEEGGGEPYGVQNARGNE
jgi:hypothetical protein